MIVKTDGSFAALVMIHPQPHIPAVQVKTTLLWAETGAEGVTTIDIIVALLPFHISYAELHTMMPKCKCKVCIICSSRTWPLPLLAAVH